MKASLLILSCLAATAMTADPEISMNFVQIANHWGYPAEEYNVTTEDGYIITMLRIPYVRAGPGSGPRPVIFFQPGFVFADAGFDVWFGNNRGNEYGRNHVTLSSSDAQFWEFTWDELAKYDLPAVVNKAISITNVTSVYYVGYSESTLTLFAHLSENGSLSSKTAYQLSGSHLFTPDELNTISGDLCPNMIGDAICSQIIFGIGGPQTAQYNTSRSAVYLAHFPSGTSSKNIVHWGQMVNYGTVSKFDYGNVMKNMDAYGQAIPPAYDFTKIATDTYLYWGNKDYLADPIDIATWLVPRLTTTGYLKGNNQLADFNHFDFVWNPRATNNVYCPIIKTIAQDGVAVQCP